jgi:hypothetical protein
MRNNCFPNTLKKIPEVHVVTYFQYHVAKHCFNTGTLGVVPILRSPYHIVVVLGPQACKTEGGQASSSQVDSQASLAKRKRTASPAKVFRILF